MLLLVSHPDAARRGEWIAALRSALPAADIADWDEASGPADYAVGWAVPPQLFATQPRLKAFFCAGAGVDDLLASASIPAQLPLLRVEDAGMGEQMADYCTAAVLGRVTHRDDFALLQAKHSWHELQPESRADWTIGIFGLGTLGICVARRFTALGFQVIGYSRTRRDDAVCRSYAAEGGAQELREFLGSSRVLILMAPLTPTTHGFFDAIRLRQLPRGSYVINVARGPLLVESALLAMLDSGHLAGAQLDVFEHEPLPAAHPYWSHARIRVTPHSAAFTQIAPAARQIAAKIRLMETPGGASRVTGLVRRDRGY